MRISDWSSDVCSSDLELFRELEAVCRADTVLATNTSALDVDAIATVLEKPGRFVGMHFFSPANVMKLCEVVQTDATDADTLATAFSAAKRIAKIPVLARNCDGIIGNRLARSEENTSELQSLMRNTYAVFCLKK